MTRVELPVALVCETCEFEFEISARYARDIRKGKRPCVCRSCRLGGVSLTRDEPSDADKAYWLERFSLPEIVEIGSALSYR